MEIKDLFGKNKKSSKKKTAKNIAVSAGVGTVLGLAAGVLLAPKSGKETREQIVKNAKDVLATVKESINEAKGRIAEVSRQKEGKCCCEDKPDENKSSE